MIYGHKILIVFLLINFWKVTAQSYEYEFGANITLGPPAIAVLLGGTFAVDYPINSYPSFLTSISYDLGTFAHAEFLGSIRDNSLRLFSIEETLKFRLSKETNPWYYGFGLGYYRFTEISHVGHGDYYSRPIYRIVKTKIKYLSPIGINLMVGNQFGISNKIAVNITLKSFIIPLWQKIDRVYEKPDGELLQSNTEVFRIIPSLYLTFSLVIKD